MKRTPAIALLSAMLVWAGAQTRHEYPLTIMPYQARAYVQDRDAARAVLARITREA